MAAGRGNSRRVAARFGVPSVQDCRVSTTATFGQFYPGVRRLTISQGDDPKSKQSKLAPLRRSALDLRSSMAPHRCTLASRGLRGQSVQARPNDPLLHDPNLCRATY
jgi:hypothetical protein